MNSLRVLRRCVSAFALGLILGTASAPARGHRDTEQSADTREVTVWAIVSTRVYHCPGSRWYGKVSPGKEMGECQAIREGYRPAFGRGCGSECPK